MIDPFLKRYITRITRLCRENNVQRLYVFGSAVDGRFIEGKSDIDFLIEFDNLHFSKKENAKSLFKMWIQLQDMLNCKVDLVVNENIQGEAFKKYLDLYKVLIYKSA